MDKYKHTSKQKHIDRYMYMKTYISTNLTLE